MLRFSNKQPAEVIPVSLDFVNLIPDGEALDDAECDITVRQTDDDEDVTSAMLVDGSIAVDGTVLGCRIEAGTSGIEYKIRFLGITENCTFEEDVALKVQAR